MATTPQHMKQQELLVRDLREAEILYRNAKEALKKFEEHSEVVYVRNAHGLQFRTDVNLVADKQDMERNLHLAEKRENDAREALEQYRKKETPV